MRGAKGGSFLVEVAFVLGLEGQAVLLHEELCAGSGLLCGENQEEHGAGQHEAPTCLVCGCQEGGVGPAYKGLAAC